MPRLVFLLSIISFSALGQKVTISGRVVDDLKKDPLPFVSVYFNNSTLGATTDVNGNYKIIGVPINQTELISSSIGYEINRIIINLLDGKNKVVDFKMKPAENLLSEITVSDTKKQNNELDAFEKIFIGTSPNALETEIVNPEVLSFSGNPFVQSLAHKKDKLSSFEAFAREPIVIINKALGYKLTLILKKFFANSEGHQILVITRFDTLAVKNSRERIKWKHNRIDTYKGSREHLFSSIIAGRYNEEGFRIYSGKESLSSLIKNGFFLNEPEQAKKENIFLDSTNHDYKILRHGIYQIAYVNKVLPKKRRINPLYPYPVSWLEIRDPYLTISSSRIANGKFNPMGYLATLRIADLLPTNFEPAEEEASLLLATRSELTSIQGTVMDEKGNPLEGAEVFINNGLTHTTTNMWGQFELVNLYPGKYPIGFAYGNKQEQLKIVETSSEKKEKVIVYLKDQQNNTVIKRDNSFINAGDAFITAVKQNRSPLTTGLYNLTNPHAFKETPNRNSFSVTTPLQIENKRLGYRWKYYVGGATVEVKKGKGSLITTGLVKMDTLKPKNAAISEQRNLEQNEEYLGSWNHFVASLLSGNLKREGFVAYALQGNLPSRPKPRFKKLLRKELQEIEADSLLLVDSGKYYLKIKKGLEIHFLFKRPFERFYLGCHNQIMRLKSNLSQVTITPTGIFNPEEITITGIRKEILTSVPVDYENPREKTTDPKVLLFVKNESLKAVKGMLEKTYIQTDKPYYYPGDTLWMKAFMRYASTTLADSLSHVLYVELLGPEGKTVDNRVLKINDSETHGDLIIPSNLAAGDYTLRAYTQWMLNFNEVFVRPLPILSNNTFVAPQPIDTITYCSSPMKIIMNRSKKEFHEGETISLDIAITKGDMPQQASLSIAITDESAVSHIIGSPTIKMLSQPFKADALNFFRITHPVEKGITISGKIMDQTPLFYQPHAGVKEPEKFAVTNEGPYTLTTLLPSKSISKIYTLKEKEFRITLDFTDTTKAILKCINKKDEKVSLELNEIEPLKNTLLAQPLSYRIIEGNLAINNTITKIRNASLLNEVTVRAKRIYPPGVVASTITSRKFGMMHKLFEGKTLADLRQHGNLRAFLQSMVDFAGTQQAILNADFAPTSATINDLSALSAVQTFNATAQDKKSNSSSATSSGANQPPGNQIANGSIDQPSSLLYNIRTPPPGARIYSFYLDGFPLDLQYFSTIPARNISRIETYLLTRNSGVISIYTDELFPWGEQNYQFKIRGFDTPHTFKTQNPLTALTDYRATIYWNPTLIINESGKTSVSFNSTNGAGKYLITIEGITKEGDAFRCVKEIEVKD